jgi:hypothetical protein
MKGRGLGPYAPGEYLDGQMAVCFAQVAATGVDLTSDAVRWVRFWLSQAPPALLG